MTKLGAGEGRPLCSAQHVKNRGLIIQEYVGVKVAGLFRLFGKRHDALNGQLDFWLGFYY